MARLDERLRTEALRLRDTAAMPAPEAGLPDLALAFEVVARVADDRRQRAVPAVFATIADAATYRDRLKSALAQRTSAGGGALAHIRPWVWTPSSGGGALTEEGNRTGVEVRLSYYS